MEVGAGRKETLAKTTRRVLHTAVGRHAFQLCFPMYTIQDYKKSKRLKTAFMNGALFFSEVIALFLPVKSNNQACLWHLRHYPDLT